MKPRPTRPRSNAPGWRCSTTVHGERFMGSLVWRGISALAATNLLVSRLFSVLSSVRTCAEFACSRCEHLADRDTGCLLLGSLDDRRGSDLKVAWRLHSS